MIYKTLADARDNSHSFASWKHKSIYRHTLADGREYFSVHEFNQYGDKCKRCKRARLKCGPCAAPDQQARTESEQYKKTGPWSELACTGHTCDRCGNPFAAKVTNGRYACLNAGLLH